MAENLLKQLKQDHQEVESIFKKLLQTEDSAQREQLIDQLQMELIPHMKSEEKVIYPALKTAGDTEVKEDALEAIEEHHAAEMVLRELIRLNPSDERFKAKCQVLMEMVQHHVQEEEKKVFKDIKEKLASQLDEITTRFNQVKQRQRDAHA